jgi:lipoic acid synthetase
VARDDLQDEGVSHFIDVIYAVRQHTSGVTVEVLVPDFHGREGLIRRLLTEGRPEVFAHNVETVERLSDVVRPQANYRRSLAVLRTAAETGVGSLIKSSIMVGLGETIEELTQTFRELVGAGVTHLTIGQYLRPAPEQLPVMEYVSPERFAAYERLAYEAGLSWVKAGPFVRSSYHAVDALQDRHAMLTS